MTEQEAAALAERLTRIWVPKGERLQSTRITTKMGQIDIALIFSGGYVFRYSRCYERYVFIQYSVIEGKDCTASLWFNNSDQILGGTEYVQLPQPEFDFKKAFTAKWLSFFRCACWLSGLSVEASAHEKAEWIQGFTREELEAWNLKM